MTRDGEMDAAQMSAPWSVRYCASRHPGEHILAKEQCADGCLGSRNCTQCRCRACPACMCYDPLGRLLQRDECGSSYKWRADVLLSASSAAGCRAACNRFAGRPNVGRPSVFAATCNTWTFGAADGACIGHVDSPLFVSGWEPHGVTHGVATCAAPSPPTEAPLLPAASPVALLSTVGSFACTDAVVRRMARAHDQCLRAGHFHSVVHISRAEGDKPNDEDVAASEALSAAVGPAAVSRIGLRELQAAFPHLLARMRGIKWSDKRRDLSAVFPTSRALERQQGLAWGGVGAPSGWPTGATFPPSPGSRCTRRPCRRLRSTCGSCSTTSAGQARRGSVPPPHHPSLSRL